MTEKDAVECTSFADKRYWYCPVESAVKRWIWRKIINSTKASEGTMKFRSVVIACCFLGWILCVQGVLAQNNTYTEDKLGITVTPEHTTFCD